MLCVHMRVCMCVCTRVCVHVCTRVCVCMCVYVHVTIGDATVLCLDVFTQKSQLHQERCRTEQAVQTIQGLQQAEVCGRKVIC